jgi:hypothetical protein
VGGGGDPVVVGYDYPIGGWGYDYTLEGAGDPLGNTIGPREIDGVGEGKGNAYWLIADVLRMKKAKIVNIRRY